MAVVMSFQVDYTGPLRARYFSNFISYLHSVTHLVDTQLLFTVLFG